MMLFTRNGVFILLASCEAAFAQIARRNPKIYKRQGYIAECTYTIQALTGDTCQGLADYGTITLEAFKSYNPQITDCNALTVGGTYCIEKNNGQPDGNAGPGVNSTSVSIVTPSSTKPPANTPPAPTQAGVASNCNRWDIIQEGDICSVYIQKYPGLTLSDLVKFNPAIGSQCTNLWVGYALCTSTDGWGPSTTITTSSRPTPSSVSGAIPAPGPTQAGVASNCNRWDLVQQGNICDTFINKYPGLSLANLVSWNPAIGSQCTNMWLGYYLCTSVVESTTPSGSSAQPTPTSNVPSPVQSGIYAGCKKYHKVVSGDGCWALANQYSIDLNTFYSWNPAVKNDCSGLWAEYYVCVGA